MHWLCRFTIGCVVLLSATTAVRSSPPPNLLLRVPFDAESMLAMVGRGRRDFRYERLDDNAPQRPVFERGKMGTAVRVGADAYLIHYHTDKNFNSAAGTMLFWLKRPGDPVATDDFYNVLGWTQPGNSWVKLWRPPGKPLQLAHGRGDQTDAAMIVGDSVADGQWHLVAITWQDRRVAVYVDGLRTGEQSASDDFPLNGFADFRVGRGGAGGMLLDELQVYDRPFEQRELRRMSVRVDAITGTPFLIIPPRDADQPITIDGRMEADEWSGAVQTTGFVDIDQKVAASTPTYARLTYDDEHLYVAVRSPWPEEIRSKLHRPVERTAVLSRDRYLFDSDVNSDDSIELQFRPGGDSGNWYRMAVNGYDVHYDYMVEPGGRVHLDWNPKWQTASTVDGNGWYVEIRIPFSELAEGDRTPGEQWQLNVIRNWRATRHMSNNPPRPMRDAWCATSASATAPVRFAKLGDPYANLLDWGHPADGQIYVNARVDFPAESARPVRMALTSDSGEVAHEQTIQPEGGELPAIYLKQKVVDLATTRVQLLIREADSDKPLLRSVVPTAPRPNLTIRASHYPTSGRYLMNFDAGGLRDYPLHELQARLELRDKTGAVVAEAEQIPLPTYVGSLELSVRNLSPGNYEAHLAVQQGEQTIAAEQLPYEKHPLPPWYGNDIGVTDEAPAPFTPVTREGDALGVWGRTYAYGNRLLPEKISTINEDIFAGPVELTVTDAAGKTYSSADADAQADWQRHTGMRIDFKRQAKLGPVTAATANWLECDGLLWTKLSVAPMDKPIARMTLRIPLKKEWSQYINSGDYGSRLAGLVSRIAPQGQAILTNALWLGNGEGGVQWMSENLNPCRPAPGAPAAEMIVEDDANVIQLNLVGGPTTLADGFEIEWGLIATPVRPPTPGYRTWLGRHQACVLDIDPRYVRDGAYYPGSCWWYTPPQTRIDWMWGYLPEPPGFFLTIEHPETDAVGYLSLGPKIFTTTVPLTGPTYAYWGDEWSPAWQKRITDDRALGFTSVGSRSFVDFIVWQYRKTYDKNRFNGIYHDTEIYWPDNNRYHGSGYAEGGVQHATYPMLGARELIKRMYCWMRAKEETTLLTYHLSGRPNMAVLSWCDVLVDGENLEGALSSQPDYHRIVPVDTFAAQFRGHNFGLTSFVLDQFRRVGVYRTDEQWAAVGSQPVDHFFGLCLLHDTAYMMAFGNFYQHTIDALRKYDFDERYEFIPYWKQQIVELPENVYATFYRDPAARRVFMVLLNNNEQNLDLRLTIDWQALGFDDAGRIQVDDEWAATAAAPADPAKADDAALCKALARIEDGQLVTPVGHANMRLIVFHE